MDRASPECSSREGQARLQKALQLAYRYLDRRERTVIEVRRHLAAKEIDSAAIDLAIRELSDLGSLDDGRFARLFAQDKRGLEQWGAQRIRRTLMSRGVDRDTVEAALADLSSETELKRAIDVLRRRFPKPPKDLRERNRALGILLRKGYDTETALDAIEGHSAA